MNQRTDPATSNADEMKTLKEIKSILRDHREVLKKQYAVKTIALFGSYTRGEQIEDSDIDILVTFSRPVGLLFIDCADYLEEILGRKVDLLTPKMINKNPYLHKSIKMDLEYV
ncbi:MAG TPA: nucleotidyltransferase family protein [Candidatus Deferrimicrobium sp.]|nr:nucleotidyltransferase family protein [Candidatus Deferrimicrobium sp.]